jgi:hypothetical protein
LPTPSTHFSKLDRQPASHSISIPRELPQMIAPLRGYQPPQSDDQGPLRDAHRWIAAKFLPEESSAPDKVRPIASWKSWLFVAWILFVTAVYFANMFGVFERQ